MPIEDYVLIGRENGTSQSDIAKIANISEREVRREIDEARIKRGQLIIADENGYYFPANKSDITEYVNRRKAAIRTGRKALAPFLKALRG